MTCDCESNLKVIREQFLDQLMYRGYISRENYQDALKDFCTTNSGAKEDCTEREDIEELGERDEEE